MGYTETIANFISWADGGLESGETAGSPDMRQGKNVHKPKFKLISDFLQSIVVSSIRVRSAAPPSLDGSSLSRVPQREHRLVFVMLVAEDADARRAEHEETAFGRSKVEPARRQHP
jgi:hypothetical protein